MASQPSHLSAVPTPPPFADALSRIAHLRTSLLIMVPLATASVEFVFHDDAPALEVILTLKPGTDHEAVKNMLANQPLSDYRFAQVTVRRAGNSLTRWLVIATVVPV